MATLGQVKDALGERDEKISSLKEDLINTNILKTVNLDDENLTNGYIKKNGVFVSLKSYRTTKPIHFEMGDTLNFIAKFPIGASGVVSAISSYDTENDKYIMLKAAVDGENQYTYTMEKQADVVFTFFYPDKDVVKIKSEKNIDWLSKNIEKNVEKIEELSESIPVEDKTLPLSRIIYHGGLTNIFQTIGIIGDSLASGEVVGKKDGVLHSEDKYEYSWGQRIAKICGNTVSNFSVGGLTTRTWLKRYGENGTLKSEIEKNLCQAYIIALGQNDSYPDSRYVPVGTASDIDLENPSDSTDSYYGNYYKIISRIKSIQPRARIFVMTNPYPRNTPETGWNYEGYDDAVRYMANTFENVFLIDFQKYAKDFHIDGNLWYSGHMTAIGYQQSAWLISTYIDWIIRNNPKDFRDVQWIGTDYYLT